MTAVITQHVLLYGLNSGGEVVPLLVDNNGSISGSGSSTPSGAAGGDLTGTYPNPTIANNAVTTNKIDDQDVTSRKIDLTTDQAEVATAQSTTSTSYTNLSTTGPTVTIATGVTQDHIISFSSAHRNSVNGTNANTSLSIAGAAALDILTTSSEMSTNAHNTCGRTYRAASQASGASHQMKYAAGAGTATFANRIASGVGI